jgi:hypothetical protein
MFDEIAALVTPTSDLPGRSARSRAVALRPGWVVAEALWTKPHREQRHAARVFAAAGVLGGRSIFSHDSAAVLWDLPIVRAGTLDVVHVSGSGVNGVVTAGTRVARHEQIVPAADVVERFGIRCTSLERTVFDLIRLRSLECAIAVADAALRQVAWNPRSRSYDRDADARWRESLSRRIAAHSGARGIRQARRVVELADGRAESPGESVSRLYLGQLRFPPPRLQVPVTGPAGERWEVDFGFDELLLWGEFDGVGKYVREDHLGGRTTAEAVLAEKRRENWIRARSGWTMVRWGWSDITSAEALRAHLAAFGIRPRIC